LGEVLIRQFFSLVGPRTTKAAAATTTEAECGGANGEGHTRM